MLKRTTVKVPKISSADRFWALVKVGKGKNPCWIWQGGLDKDKKYGAYGGMAGSRVAHRIAWNLTYNTTLSREIVLHHTCPGTEDGNPLCVNPAHLEQMSDAEHRSMHSKQRWDDHRAGKKRFRKAGDKELRPKNK